MPFPQEHSCRLKNPNLFTPGSFRSYSRTSDGKKYRVIAGRLKGETTMTEQGFRYPKDAWTSAQASKHCKDHDGIKFEPAKEVETLDIDIAKNLLEEFSLLKNDIMEMRSGRVISAKNRRLLTDCHGKMNEAAQALAVLLKETAVEEERDSESEAEEEERSGDDKKLKINFELAKLKPPVKAVKDGDKVIKVIDKEQAKKLAEELVEKLDLRKIVQEKLDFLKGKVQ